MAARATQTTIVRVRINATPAAAHQSLLCAPAVTQDLPGLHVRDSVLDPGPDSAVGGVEVLFPLRQRRFALTRVAVET
ncbi:hypothetical protein GCM10022220_07610 [Actinocatenispora rupis]|uniref:Uncharacterized protein n=1 Tax=Actinocatenispora rupis TaxID=519421 RepID=A0A8J3IUN9_9ACTN|nr:hypothetical protein Aru02nite_11300 [Actinocatenispora rupis]